MGYKGRKQQDLPSTKLRKFIERDVLTNAYRTGRGFIELVAASPAQMVYQRHQVILRRVFTHYAGSDKSDLGHQSTINLIEFSEFAKELKMMKGEGGPMSEFSTKAIFLCSTQGNKHVQHKAPDAMYYTDFLMGIAALSCYNQPQPFVPLE